MKILLSAYACEPDLGSEAAVGWGWATTLAKSHDVYVITRESNRQRIERKLSSDPIPNLHFIYYDLPAWMRRWKRGSRGVYIYYYLWQYLIYRRAKKLAVTCNFDIVHHVTFAGIRSPSFMGRLPVPFIFGPVAGGEYSPIRLWWTFGWRARFWESLRYLSALWVRISPTIRRTLREAAHIIVTSDQTASLIPRNARARSSKMLAIAAGPMPAINEETASHVSEISRINQGYRVFFAGRFIYWKGMELGLHAFARLCRVRTDATLTMIGSGPEKLRWEKLTRTLGIQNKVSWIEKLPHEEFLRVCSHYDTLLFPSLHDSGGMVVLEAMNAAVPVVCLDVGGPATLVNHQCGCKIPLGTREQVIQGLGDAMLQLASDSRARKLMGHHAAVRVSQEFSWDVSGRKIETIYRLAMQAK